MTCTCHSSALLDKTLADNQVLRNALVGFVGVDDVGQLQAMEAFVRASGSPNMDKTIAINAIHALIKTMPVTAEG